MAKVRKSKVTDNNSGGVVPGVDSAAAGGVAVEAAGNGAAAGGAVIVRNERGRFQKGTVPGNLITSDNARDMLRARKEKTAALLRKEISAAIFGRDVFRPSEAVAIVGAQLYQQVASNPDANPRYRLEVWQAVGRHAGLLGDNRQDAAQDGVTVSIGADLARDLVDKLLQSRGGGA